MSEGKRRTPPKPPHDDPRVREALVLLDIVAKSLSKQLGGRYDFDELRAYGHEALTELVAKFEPARGVSFRAFARLRLRGAIIDGVRREAGLPRGVLAHLRALDAGDLYVEARAEENATARPAAAAAADIKLANFLRGMATAYSAGLLTAKEPEGDAASSDVPVEHDDPQLQFERQQKRAFLERILGELGEPEASLLHRHYFLDEDLQDASSKLGMSKSWGSRLHARAIEKLAARLRELRARGEV